MTRWFRVYEDLVDDPKVQRLDPSCFKALINLWCLASANGGSWPHPPHRLKLSAAGNSAGCRPRFPGDVRHASRNTRP